MVQSKRILTLEKSIPVIWDSGLHGTFSAASGIRLGGRVYEEDSHSDENRIDEHHNRFDV